MCIRDSAARTPGTLFAAMEAPVPVQQHTTAWSAAPSATSRAAASEQTAHCGSAPGRSAPCTRTSWPRRRSSSTRSPATGSSMSEETETFMRAHPLAGQRLVVPLVTAVCDTMNPRRGSSYCFRLRAGRGTSHEAESARRPSSHAHTAAPKRRCPAGDVPRRGRPRGHRSPTLAPTPPTRPAGHRHPPVRSGTCSPPTPRQPRIRLRSSPTGFSWHPTVERLVDLACEAV